MRDNLVELALRKRCKGLEAALERMLARYDSVDNGHCTTCGGYRLWLRPGVVGPCENPRCDSHGFRALLSGPT